MSSVIDVRVLGEDGEQLSHARFTVDYGNEEQHVVVILDAVEGMSDVVNDSFLEVNEMLVENGIVHADRKSFNA